MIKNYQQIKVLGKGNYGTVMLIRDRDTQQLFALKIVSQCCFIESEIMTELSHPNILKIYGFERSNHNLSLLLEYVEGGDLKKYITKGFELEQQLIVSLLAQIVLAMHYLHNQGSIIHRDVKVENILIGSNGLIKLADFGISRKMGKQQEFVYSQVGTPMTLSPQRIQKLGYDKKSDIWGIGCVLYQLMSKKKPFTVEKQSIVNLFQKILNQDPDPLPESYSPWLKTLVMSFLSKNPQKRPTTNEVLQIKQIKKQLLRLRQKHPQYKQCKYMNEVLDNAKTSKFTQIQIQLSISRSVAEALKTSKSKLFVSQGKSLQNNKYLISKSFRKDNQNVIEDRFYTLSLPFFIQQAKKRKEKGE